MKLLKSILLNLIIGLLVFITSNNSYGEIPRLISFQGVLKDAAGSPQNGDFNMTFKLYATATGGSAIWTEVRDGVNKVKVENGLYNVLLGEMSNLANVSFDKSYWLGIQVENDMEMTPRYRLAASPYTLNIADIPSFQCLWTRGTGDDIYHLKGNVGIEIATPKAKLHIKGNLLVGNNPSPFPALQQHQAEIRGGTCGPWALLVETNNRDDAGGAMMEFNGTNLWGILNIFGGTATDSTIPHRSAMIKLHPAASEGHHGSGVGYPGSKVHKKVALLADGNDEDKFKIITGIDDYTNLDNPKDIFWRTKGLTAMTITKEGKVGIGPDKPQRKLHLSVGEIVTDPLLRYDAVVTDTDSWMIEYRTAQKLPLAMYIPIDVGGKIYYLRLYEHHQ